MVGRVGGEPTARWLRGWKGQFLQGLVVAMVSPLLLDKSMSWEISGESIDSAELCRFRRKVAQI